MQENERPLWANRMVNALTGLTFFCFAVIVLLILLKLLAIVAEWAVS